MMINAGSLFAVAKEAYARATATAADSRSHVSHDPLVAIVFAAAAGEAFVNEIVDLAAAQTAIDSELDPEPQEVRDLVALLSEVEGSRATTGLKFRVGKLALVGKTYDKGGNPYQDFAILMELRNSLVHLKSERLDQDHGSNPGVKHPRVIERLRATNVLVQLEGEDAHASWIYLISTPAAAKWACNATANIVTDLLGSIPVSQLRSKVDFFYCRYKAFAPIE